MPTISIKADLRPLQKAFIALGAKQVPFATSLALNALAKGVAVEDRKAVDQTFKSPTPFTENGVCKSATRLISYILQGVESCGAGCSSLFFDPPRGWARMGETAEICRKMDRAGCAVTQGVTHG